ncbi:hypothetical protein GJ496_010653 [Pomphorhynchus laevis]|nr:hypothetical protein GJ496_010653 [Pomphorhynchus laevis]
MLQGQTPSVEQTDKISEQDDDTKTSDGSIGKIESSVGSRDRPDDSNVTKTTTASTSQCPLMRVQCSICSSHFAPAANDLLRKHIPSSGCA